MSWHQKEPNLAQSLSEELAKKYPDLRLEIVGEIGEITGSFPIIYDGVEVDRFHIRVLVPKEFPEKIPIAFEIAERIPISATWHTFAEKNLCVIVPEEWLLNPQSISLMAYFDGPFRNYFISHALAEAGQPRPMGERSHGSIGLYEAYGEMVQSTDRKAIESYLDYISAKKLKSHWPCPCGSGKRVCICHLAHTLELRKKIPRKIAAQAYKRLREALTRESAQAAASAKSAA